MDKIEICKMCEEYFPEQECEHENTCKLIAVLKENEQLKSKYAKLKKKYDALSLKMSWIENPECMGR